MKAFYEIAGTVMGFFDAFKGSRPAINNEQILIVRGRSRNVIPLNQFENKLNEVAQELNAEEISDEKIIGDILSRGNDYINKNAETTAIDKNGFHRMKKELESMGLVVAYKVLNHPKCDIVIAIWEDKNELPPLYVEVTVTAKDIK